MTKIEKKVPKLKKTLAQAEEHNLKLEHLKQCGIATQWECSFRWLTQKGRIVKEEGLELAVYKGFLTALEMKTAVMESSPERAKKLMQLDQDDMEAEIKKETTEIKEAGPKGKVKRTKPKTDKIKKTKPKIRTRSQL